MSLIARLGNGGDYKNPHPLQPAKNTLTETTYDVLGNYAYSAEKKRMEEKLSPQGNRRSGSFSGCCCLHRPTVAALFPSTFPKSVLAKGTGDRRKPARICILHCAPLPVVCTEKKELRFVGISNVIGSEPIARQYTYIIYTYIHTYIYLYSHPKIFKVVFFLVIFLLSATALCGTSFLPLYVSLFTALLKKQRTRKSVKHLHSPKSTISPTHN